MCHPEVVWDAFVLRFRSLGEDACLLGVALQQVELAMEGLGLSCKCGTRGLCLQLDDG